MATKVRRRNPSLTEQLRDEPYRFALLQAVQISEAANPDAIPLGTGFNPDREALIFRGSLSQNFPASDLEGWRDNPRTGQPELTSAFLSLGGAFGPLPPPYSELARDRARRGDTGIRDFLDIFHHRLLSVFVRIKRAHRPALQNKLPQDTGFSRYLWALTGLLTPGLRHSMGRKQRARLPGLDPVLLTCSGLINQRPVSAHMLEQVLTCAFAIPVRIASFAGRWMALDTAQTTVLGRGGRNCRLGENAVAGQQVWDQSAAITIRLYPQTLSQMCQLLPGSLQHRQLRDLTGYLLGDLTRSDTELVLPAAEVPQSRLTSDAGAAPRLGWTSWLGTGPRTRDGVVRLGQARAGD